MRFLSSSRYSGGDCDGGLGVVLLELTVVALECFCAWDLGDGRGSWKMGGSAEIGVGVGVVVGALEELPEARVEMDQAGELWRTTRTILSSVMVCPAWYRYRLSSVWTSMTRRS